MLVEVKKNGQVASVKTRRILNKGNGLYELEKQTDTAIWVRCTTTRWTGWLPKKEIHITPQKHC